MENGSFDSQEESSVASGPLSAAFGFVTRIASELFARGKKHLDGSNSDAMDEVESHQSNEVSESGDDTDKIEDENRIATSECTVMTTNDSSAEKSEDVVMADEPADSDCLKHFDVLQCPPDHHYLENIAQVRSIISLHLLLTSIHALHSCLATWANICFEEHVYHCKFLSTVVFCWYFLLAYKI
jgi:hypothetical protein